MLAHDSSIAVIAYQMLETSVRFVILRERSAKSRVRQNAYFQL